MINSISLTNGASVAPFSAISENIGVSKVSPVKQPQTKNSSSAGQQKSSDNRSRLEGQVAGQQRRKLSRDGERMLAFRLLAGDLETAPELPGGTEDSFSGMQAVVISADENNPTDMNVKILRVDGTGNSEEIYSTENLEELFPDGQAKQLNLRGGQLDTYS